MPRLDAGQELLLPFLWDGHQLDVPLDLRREFLLSYEIPVFAPVPFVLVRATVVVKAKAALFDVLLGDNRIAAAAAGGEIQEKKTLVAALLAGPADADEGGLDVIEGLFGDHGHMNSLVHFTLVNENSVEKGVVKQLADGGKRQWLLASGTDESNCRHFLLDGGQRISARSEFLQNAFHFGEILAVRHDGAELRLVHVSKRGFAAEDASADFLADAALDVHREVADILVCHAKLDGNHEDVVGRQI